MDTLGRERIRCHAIRCESAAAEFLGTFTLIMFGVGVVAQVVLGEKAHGEYLSINLGWGLAVTMGAYVAGGISGAHLNPAVTLALAVHRGFAWRKVLPYWIAQMAGAFAASAVVYFTYREAIDHFEGASAHAGHCRHLGHVSARTFSATFPAALSTRWSARHC